MEEGLDEWHKLQDSLNKRTDFPRPKRRQVWWCAVGYNIGSEQSCTIGFQRPVLVLRVFGSIFWGLPITSSDPEGKKDDNPLFYKIEGIPYLSPSGEKKNLEGYVALHQLRAYDSRRLQRKILKMELGLFELILRELRRYL